MGHILLWLYIDYEVILSCNSFLDLLWVFGPPAKELHKRFWVGSLLGLVFLEPTSHPLCGLAIESLDWSRCNLRD